MLKKLRERNIHFLMLAFFIGLFLGINFSFMATASEPAHKYLDYFHQVYQIIRTKAVETPSNKEMFYNAIRGMIKSLDDPYSRFLDEQSFRNLREMTTGKFVGVGIEISTKGKEIVVISPIANSPAMEAGVQTGDIIVKVNDKAIRGMKLVNVVKMIKGLPGSEVKLSMRREGTRDLIDYEIKRMPIDVASVDFSVMEQAKIGYLRIKSFNSNTTTEVVKALESFNSNKVKKIIVDLRSNPGGLLKAAVNISDLFLDKDKTIVSTKGRSGSGIDIVYKSENDPMFTGKMVVLVNKGSASASEIFAGAMRDNNRGKLVGDKTFGKGSVQKVFELSRKAAVAITIARYYTPSGELIHGKGIIPDYTVKIRKLSKKDRKNIILLRKKNLMEDFVKSGMEYDVDSKTRFIEFLRKHNIVLSKRTANFILKRRINKFRKRSLYDLEFDKQLHKAISVVNR